MSSGGIPIRSELVACFVLRKSSDDFELLVLYRAIHDAQAPGISQIVYGHVEADESATVAVIREVLEETGLKIDELYSLNETFIFYDEASDSMQLTPVFVAFAGLESHVVIDPEEHSGFEWVGLASASLKLPWPVQQRVLQQLIALLKKGSMPPIMKMQTNFKIHAY